MDAAIFAVQDCQGGHSLQEAGHARRVEAGGFVAWSQLVQGILDQFLHEGGQGKCRCDMTRQASKKSDLRM
eukprot:973870-Pelagomonas_calceolata.AAC.1